MNMKSILGMLVKKLSKTPHCSVHKVVLVFQSKPTLNVKILSWFEGLSHQNGLVQKEEQGSHRLEKYLNLEGILEKSLKIKFALESTGKSCKGLEKSLNSFSVGINTVDRDLNQYKIVVPLFDAAYVATNIGTTIVYLFSSTNVTHYLSLAFLK